MANTDLIATDPMVAQNFALEVDGAPISILSGVSGLDIELDVVTIQQNGAKGKMQQIKTRGQMTKAPDLSLTRMAPADSTSDGLWKWFNDVRTKGFALGDRTSNRKNGAVVMYDSVGTEVGRFSFFSAWPSKISTDAMSTDSNDAVKETITLVCERIERVK
jgi:phage tail-like protein